MNNTRLLLPSSIGLVMLAVIVPFASWTISTLWIPISAVFILLGVIVFVLRSTFASMEERLNKLEKENDTQLQK